MLVVEGAEAKTREKNLENAFYGSKIYHSYAWVSPNFYKKKNREKLRKGKESARQPNSKNKYLMSYTMLEK